MSKMEFAPKSLKTLSFLFLLFLIGCAEIGSPPGGEIDKVKPRIIESTPIDGSTLVEPSNTISITFSERITKPTTKRSIYISPRPNSQPDVKWKSDKVIITLPDSFAIDQTYIISFAEGVQDLRRNALDTGSIIAFTTGENLADGTIKGSVVDQNNTPLNNIVTALYNKTQIDQSIVIDSIYPIYMGITNSDGYFSFNYIPDGEYLLLAFVDKNKNDKLDHETELYGMSDRSIVLDSTQKVWQKIQIPVTSHFEGEQIIMSVRQTDNNLFKIDFNHLLQNQIDSQNFDLSILNYIDSSKIYNSRFVLKSDPNFPKTIEAYFGKLEQGKYKFIFKQHQNDSAIFFDSVNVKTISDDISPTIKTFNPESYNVFKEDLQIFLQFSEPIDTTRISKETFYFLDNDSNLIIPEFEFVNPSLCNFSNNFFKDDLYKYNLHISEFDVFDLNGNKLGDSTTIKEINFINNDSLGIIQGHISHGDKLLSNSQTILLFQNLLTSQIFTYTLTDSSFMKQLPQGNYFLSSFIDLNKNKIRDFGSVTALQYPEPYVNYGDTIKIRARFETTDILLEFK